MAKKNSEFTEKHKRITDNNASEMTLMPLPVFSDIFLWEYTQMDTHSFFFLIPYYTLMPFKKK